MSKYKNLVNKHKRFIVLTLVTLVLILIAKKFFFVTLFIFLNYFVLWMKFGMGFDSPIEVISFATFMCSYVYGPVEGMIVAGSSLIAISLTGRMNTSKLFNNLVYFIIAYLVQFFRGFDIALAGIGFLIGRYVIDAVWNLVLLRNSDYMRKIPNKIINFVFYVLVYFSFSHGLASLMRL